MSDITDRLAALAEHVAKSLPGAVTASETRRGELCVTIERDELLRVLQFLRDDPKCRFRALRHLRSRLS